VVVLTLLQDKVEDLGAVQVTGHIAVVPETLQTLLHHRGTMEVALPVLEHLHMLVEAEEVLVVLVAMLLLHQLRAVQVVLELLHQYQALL
jgi:hypothetical protein